MDLQPDLREDRWSRAAAAAGIVALALERNLPHMALAAAREAARSALLALGKGPRRLAGPDDLALLHELAAASPQHLAGRSAERQALFRATLSVLHRLFPEGVAARRGGPPRDLGAATTSRPRNSSPASAAALDLDGRRGGATGIDSVGGSDRAGSPPEGLGSPRRPRKPLPQEGPRLWS